MIPQHIKERIAKDATEKYPTFSRLAFGLAGDDTKQYIHIDHCIKLMEAEAERALPLVEMLEKVLNIIQPDTPTQIREIKKLVRETLTKYNNSK